MDIQQIAEDIRPLIYEAGKMAMKYFRNVKAEQKKDLSYVTAADREIEEYLRGEILKRFPDHQFYGEESGHHNQDNPEYVWSCDPIDGTALFVYELPIWCVSLGLIQQNRNLLGFIYLPVLDDMYWAVEGQGAYCNDKRIYVSGEYDMNTCEACILMPSRISHEYQFTYPGRILEFGSAAANLAFVSAGKINGGLQSRLNLYDICGGSVILQEAGGVMRYINNGNEVNLWELIDGRRTPCPYFYGNDKNVEQLLSMLSYQPDNQ